MFVYVWKHGDAPFYVGMSKTRHRTNPLNAGGRGWLCKQKLEAVGPNNVVVEIHPVADVDAAMALERSLIEKYGRVQLGTGPLTNLRKGGEKGAVMSEDGRARVSKRMRENNPMHHPEVRAKVTARMQAPDTQAKLRGANNPAKRIEVREKLVAKWKDPEYRAAQTAAKTGRKKHTDEFKAAARARLLQPENPLRTTHIALNTNPEIHKKRVETLRSPEARAKKSEIMRKVWAAKKASTVSSK